jgi:hypothetical protein
MDFVSWDEMTFPTVSGKSYKPCSKPPTSIDILIVATCQCREYGKKWKWPMNGTINEIFQYLQAFPTKYSMGHLWSPPKSLGSPGQEDARVLCWSNELLPPGLGKNEQKRRGPMG